jgi:hypothetical protein
MPVLRSPAPVLAIFGACLAACFTDAGAPALTTEPATATTITTGVDPGTADTGTSTTATATSSTGEATTTDATTAVGATGATSTGCVLETWYFDIDMDGYGGSMSTEKCGAPGPGFTLDSLDCDDSKPAINPAAVEVCDLVDNDCDGGVDEYPVGQMDACNGCQAVVGTTSTYYFCTTPMLDWDSARTRCTTLLGDLVSINDADENLFIRSKINGQNLRWWLGLSDSANEGQFVWVDQSALDPKLPIWVPNEPDNADADFPGSPANCVILSEAVFANWRDEACADVHGFICEAPLPI